MITAERQQEIAEQYAATMERYLEKQWIDSEAADSIAENSEERDFIRLHVGYSVVAQYSPITPPEQTT